LSDDTNPDEEPKKGAHNKRKDAVAVAMSYHGQTDQAPRVVAGGRGTVAEQILEIAFANGIKVREDADLAELLSAIDLDDEIPPEAFAAVAEILIYVYKANGNWPDYLNEAFGGPAPNPKEAPKEDGSDMPDNGEDTTHG
jgi:flagellar biosynthesis protein